MRIIAGKWKGKKLNTPPDSRIRPTLDRVREAIFSMIAFDIPSSDVLDLFGGTGVMSMEVLSRGANSATIVDNHKDSVTLIKKNVGLCGANAQTTIFSGDYRDFLAKINKTGNKFDIIFVDPPYQGEMVKEVLEEIDKNDVCGRNGIVILETARDFTPPEQTQHFIKIKEKNYSKTKISVYQIQQKEI